MLNDFYDIAPEGKEPKNAFQLANLGRKRPRITVGKNSRTSWGEREASSETLYTQTTSEDYDHQFVSRIYRTNPPYVIDRFLDHHYKHYSKMFPGNEKTFFKHLKYVTIPLLQKGRHDIYVELINEWLEEKKNVSAKVGPPTIPTTLNEKLDKILEFLVANAIRNNINPHTIHEEIFEKSITFQEAQDLHRKLLVSGKVRVIGHHYIGHSIDTYTFLQQGGFSNKKSTNSNPLNSNLPTPTIEMKSNPKTFISYAWESDEVKEWVKQLALKLRNIGIDAKLDQWELVPGDQMPHFMEKSVRENDYVLIICSPKYKEKSENRLGGVGYEGDIMTAEVLQNSNHRKFIPILQSGTKESSIPSWLKGKYYIDLSSDYHFNKNIDDLITTLFNARESAPELGPIPSKFQNQPLNVPDIKIDQEEKIRIKGILVDEVTQPSNDRSKGSALYKIPFELNREPDNEWKALFINAWNRPAQLTPMHRSGIASVYGNQIILDGTTIEEVEQYHKRTLKLAVEVANNIYTESRTGKKQIEEDEKKLKEEHRKNIDDVSKRINFD